MSFSNGSSWLVPSPDVPVSGSASGHDRRSSNPHEFDLDIGLVGRDQERLVLEQAYERVCCRVQQASSEMVLVEGASGTGKTALVLSSLRESIDREDMGLFALGKYDLQSAAPYEAIVDAATELCHAVSDSEYYLEDVKEHLQTVLSNVDDKQLLLTLVPPVGVLLDMDGEDETEIDQASNKTHAFALRPLMRVICKFWNAVASVHPVVLFLDDLQFADASAKELLSALVTDMSSTNLLVVGAFRDGEFEWKFDGTSSDSARWRISKIDLGELSQASVKEIVSRVTKRRPDEMVGLSEALFDKTGGNALFLMQFLDMLHSTGLLFFNFRRNQWEWEDEITSRTDVSDNVAELLMQKLGRLSTPTQVVLILASCLGHSFDVGALETIFLSSEGLRSHLNGFSEGPSNAKLEKQSFRAAIVDAVKVGLIEQVSNKRFKFSHDAIQQAAFSTSPPGMDKEIFHSVLGEQVLSLSRTEHGEDWMLFSAANLLTGCQLVVEASQLPRVALAELCLEVCQKALAKSAFVTAATYADRGYSLLDKSERWTSQYALSLNLLTLSAKMHFAYGDQDGALRACSDVISHAPTASDKHSAQVVLVSIHFRRKEQKVAISQCMAILQENGIVFPTKATKFHILFNWWRVRKLLNGRGALDLLQLSRSNDVTTRVCQLLYMLANAAYFSGEKELSQLASLMVMRLTLAGGISSYSACSIAVYGVLLSQFGKIREAYEYGRLALEMERKCGNKLTLARTHARVYPLLLHLREPLHGSLEPLKLAYETGMQVGDLSSAALCLVWRAMLGFHGGMRLDHLEIQTREYRDLFRHYNLAYAVSNILPLLQLFLNLLGKSRDPLILSGEAIRDETEFAAHQRKSGNTSSLVTLQNLRMVLLVLLDELDLADAERTKHPSEIPGMYHHKFCNWFFCALTCIGVAKRRKREGHRLQSRRYMNQAQKYRKRLNKLAQQGSINCIPLVKLLDAEATSIRTALHEESVKLYQDAIAASGRCGFRMCTGLAYEKAGEYLLERGDHSRATNYLQCAWNEFTDFGATAKLSQMDRKYGGTVSFQMNDETFPSRPSSLTTPHCVRSAMTSSTRKSEPML